MPPVHRIVLTGGPCGGKTTALARVQERLSSLGFRVFLVPEAATMLISGGVSFRGVTAEQVVGIDSSLVGIQMALEDGFGRIARSCGSPSVVLCDRGVMDNAAYLPPVMWQALLDEHGWTPVALRDQRYDAVLHLVTAADGAEAFYTTANNPARTETPEQARAIDLRLREVWLGHPHLRVITNETDFAQKVRRVVEAVCRVVGAPEPVEIERKHLVRRAPDVLPVKHQEVEIDQTYLATSDGSEARVRRRGQQGAFTYTRTIKRPLRAGQRVEVERAISGREYLTLLAQADPARRTVRKRRTCFLWEGQYFELDRFVDPRAGLILLEAELDDASASVKLPPFLEIERDVTDEKEYSNWTIAGAAP